MKRHAAARDGNDEYVTPAYSSYGLLTSALSVRLQSLLHARLPRTEKREFVFLYLTDSRASLPCGGEHKEVRIEYKRQ
jgi:hypothetical protein